MVDGRDTVYFMTEVQAMIGEVERELLGTWIDQAADFRQMA